NSTMRPPAAWWASNSGVCLSACDKGRLQTYGEAKRCRHRERAPAVLRPERFRTRATHRGLLILAPSASPKAAFQRPSTRAVLLPERCRGGCASGAGASPASPARAREECGSPPGESSEASFTALARAPEPWLRLLSARRKAAPILQNQVRTS